MTGTLGDSFAGLKVFDIRKRDKIDQELEKYADFVIEKHSFPSPRIEEGKFLAENRLASSMIDLSDGIASDIKRLSEQSKVGARIFSKFIPISKEMRELVKSFGGDPLEFALYGGEDYELLFTVRKEDLTRFTRLKETLNTPASHIGEIVRLEEGINLVQKDNTLSPFNRIGYEHFKG